MQEASPAGQIDWQAETTLDPTIQFRQFRHPGSTFSLAPRAIFLTGATGFLGAFLLNELLRTSNAYVYCLVRHAEIESGAQKLRTHLEHLGVWSETFVDRIIPVRGDLSRPLLGLSQDHFNDLAERIDVIHHNGAHIDFLRPYGALKATNVLGTQEVLRFAGTGRTKPLHHISSLAVFFSKAYIDKGMVSELDAPVLDAGINTGYAQSKWVAEKLVLEARERGLPAAIYRTARIAGHSRTGVTSNMQDLLNRIIRACIHLRAYPTLTMEIAMVPVDYVSRAITNLSTQERSFGRAFHLFHPQPISWSTLVQMIRSLGYPLTECSYDEWRAALKRTATTNHPARETLGRLWIALNAPNQLLTRRPQYETPYLREGLEGTGIECPPLDETLVRAYISFFQKCGDIPMP